MNAQLEALISQETERKAVIEADKAIAKQNATEAVRRAVKEAIGAELDEQFQAQGITKSMKASPNRFGEEIRWSVEIIWQVNGSDEARLCPITLRAVNNEKSVTVYASLWHNQHRREEVPLPERMAAFLLEARVHWTTWRKDRANVEIHKITNIYEWKTDAETIPALEALMAEYPEIAQDANEMIAECNKKREDLEKKHAKMQQDSKDELERRRKEVLLFNAKVQRYVEFQKERNAVMARNIKRRMDIQTQLDRPVEIFKLTYGVCAQSDDCETFADQNSIYVLDPGADEDGYWEKPGGEKVKVFYPVMVEPMMVMASNFYTLNKSRPLDDDLDLQSIKYFWLHDIGEVNKMIAQAHFEQLPRFKWSEEFSHWDRECVVEKACEIEPSLTDRD